MNKLIKHNSMDKDDGYILTKRQFIHDDYYVSDKQNKFHTASAYAYHKGTKGGGFSVGTQKQMWRASGKGIMIDGYYGVGQSDS